MGRSINREVRVLPIDRVAHTAADIDHLREEFEMMTRDAVPLIWSSNDIQTLINSWIEDMEKQRCLFSGWQREFDTIDGDGDRKLTWKECKAKGMLEKTFKLADADGNGYIDLAEYEAWFTLYGDADCEKTVGGKPQAKLITRAWQRLFKLLRESAEIVGDEIHAILDILTSYNFAMGAPQKLSTDEMDAVENFLKVVTNHPDITGYPGQPAPTATATRFDFLRNDTAGVNKGRSLSANWWENNLRTVVADALIARGITNDPITHTFVREGRRCLPPSATPNDGEPPVQDTCSVETKAGKCNKKDGCNWEDDACKVDRVFCFGASRTELECAEKCSGWTWGSVLTSVNFVVIAAVV